ncbi:MAG: NIPSNAP family protein [Bacteroidetes bacterium]|nr:NIPSNAP family protein [Bacteroidota bacterium]MDA1122340.1 NIPSNAP family protein [Bacteroidota bacterium]
MKYLNLITVLTVFLVSCNEPATQESEAVSEPTREFYQLKTYEFASDDQVQRTDSYLGNAFIPALHKLGIQNVGVFKNIQNENDTSRLTYVLIPFSSLDQFEGLEAQLAADNTYQQTGSDYINATYDNAPYQRTQSTVLKAFVDMPQMKPSPLTGPRADRIYELRSYEAATEAIHINKVDMFNAGGEVALFERLEFNAVFYARVISGSTMPNLMYMTTFSDRANRDEHWQAFSAAPEWQTLKVDPKYQNNVSKNVTKFLYPTDYSDY